MAHIATTGRLVLRHYLPSDADTVARLVGDYAVSQWLTSAPHPYSRDDALAFFEAFADSDRVCAVTRAGEVIGCVSILADLGYWYGAPFWGQGFATEAATALGDLHFADSDTDLESGYLDGNASSQRVLEKLGFVPNGQSITYSQSRKCDVPNHRMILRQADWRARP
ncbi:MAG: GNAT family N-acetyltransferase [Pseudomonadota bacterium]